MGLLKAHLFYDTIAKTYDQRFDDKVALIENELATMRLPTRNVLDLGCGTGLYLEYCQPSGYIGLDISTGMLAVAQAKFPDATFIQSDMSAIPLPDNSVDAVVSLFGSFSYCLTPHRCVDEINRVLRPDGRVLVMAYGQRYINRPSHIAPHLNFWTYTARQLKHLFAPIGNVKVRGLNMAIDRLDWLPERLLRGYAWCESQTVNRWLCDACYFLIVEVTKDAQANACDERIRCRHQSACAVV